MPDAVPHLVANDVAREWAGAGGPDTEYAIACRDGSLLALAALEVTARWDDNARRAGLGVLGPVSECGSFGFLTDTTASVNGHRVSGLLCLELSVIDFGSRSVDVAVFFAPYVRAVKRFGRDIIQIGGMDRLDTDEHQDITRQLMLTWDFSGAEGKSRGIKMLQGMNAHLNLIDPSLKQEIAGLIDPE